MIDFLDVSKVIHSETEGIQLVLRDASLRFPSGSRIALLGENKRALTTVLQLLAGSELPDGGYIVKRGVRLSPIINAGSWAGGSLAPVLTGLDNINFFARAHGIDPRELRVLVESSSCLGEAVRVPVRQYPPEMRRALEVSLIAALPFDCYLVDNISVIEKHLLWKLFQTARARDAGLIFTMHRLRDAAKLAEVTGVLRQGSIQMFRYVRNAIAYHQLA
jgi:ABC-type polysaccharide/polyol phosphate transport system ATPase subunit